MAVAGKQKPDVKDEAAPSLLDELEKRLATDDGKPVQLKADADEIGGELLAILSKGLYTNPLDCLREYAQNGVDAQAETITIKVTGNTVMIFDDGVGMGLADLLQAKKFGLSPKSIVEHVGFRGIGIYSGFDLCRRLVITSSKEGDPSEHVMSFEFAAMKAQLDKERQDSVGTKRTSLVELLSAHATIARRSDSESVDAHYTHVELRDIQPEHIALLSDKKKLRDYLLQNLPIAFAASFEHGAAIDAKLRAAVPAYNPIRVKLQLDGQREETVQKYGPAPEKLAEYAADPGAAQKPEPQLKLSLAMPIFSEVHNKTGQPIAFYWACLNKNRTRLEPGEKKPQFEGLV
jgi:hypothetical protein